MLCPSCNNFRPANTAPCPLCHAVSPLVNNGWDGSGAPPMEGNRSNYGQLSSDAGWNGNQREFSPSSSSIGWNSAQGQFSPTASTPGWNRPSGQLSPSINPNNQFGSIISGNATEGLATGIVLGKLFIKTLVNPLFKEARIFKMFCKPSTVI